MRLIDLDNINSIELEDSICHLRHEKGDEVDWHIDAPVIKMAEDCVNKEHALSALIATVLEGWQLAIALEAIDKLPSVVPQPERGKWIRIGNSKLFKSSSYKCSKCGNTLNFNGVNAGRGDANFCPNCGADMREVQDDR